MCLYDLQKAFDSVEFSVLLVRLFEVGVYGKTWRLLRSWYQDAVGQVKYDRGRMSEKFSIGRGVKQGSILSPVLFLLVMDPLLQCLETSKVGLTVNGFYVGGFEHADDIMQDPLFQCELPEIAQVEIVKGFARDKFLKLNVSKCEVVEFGRQCVQGAGLVSGVEVEGVVIPSKFEGKCLGYWWRSDLLAVLAVDENIQKAMQKILLPIWEYWGFPR